MRVHPVQSILLLSLLQVSKREERDQQVVLPNSLAPSRLSLLSWTDSSVEAQDGTVSL